MAELVSFLTVCGEAARALSGAPVQHPSGAHRCAPECEWPWFDHLTQALTPAEYVEKPQEAAASTSDHPSSKAAPPRLLFLKGRDRDCAFNPGTPEYIAYVEIIPEQRTASVSVSFQRNMAWGDRDCQKTTLCTK